MPPRPRSPTMRYWPPMIVPETKRARSSESEVGWMADSREGVAGLPLRAEAASGRGFDVSGSLRVFAFRESTASADSSAECSTRAPHEGHDRLSSAISAVQEIHLMRRELYHLRESLTVGARPARRRESLHYALAG